MRAETRSKAQWLYGGMAGVILMVAPGSVFAQQQPAPATPAAAQALRQEIDQLRADFEARLSALETRLAALGGPTTADATAATPQAATSAPAAPGLPTAQVPSGA